MVASLEPLGGFKIGLPDPTSTENVDPMPATAHRASRKPIGIVLKDARLRKGLKADDVAAFCNVSRSRVYQWEADIYVFPKNLPALAAVLGVPIKKLKAANRTSH